MIDPVDWNIVDLTDGRWSDYVASHPDATPFHHPAWASTIAECYGLRAHAFLGTRSGEVCAGVPFMAFRDLRGRQNWKALPFTDWCPPLTAASDDPSGLSGALGTAFAEAAPGQAEIRADIPNAGALHATPVGVRHVLQLADDASTVLAGASSMNRRNVKRAQNHGCTARIGRSPEDVAAFYRLHLATRKRQGVPIQPRRLFDLVRERMVDDGLASVVVVERESQAVAAMLLLHWGKVSVYKWGASDESAWAHYPNNLLMAEAIDASIRQGCSVMDFGRTDFDDTGLRAFKSGWGATEIPLSYATTRRSSGDDNSRGAVGKALAAVIRSGPDWVCETIGRALYRWAA